MSKLVVLDGLYFREHECCWTSRERGVHLGEVRLINESLHYAGNIQSTWLTVPKILWFEMRPEDLKKVSP